MAIDFTKLLAKLDPPTGGEGTVRMRTGTVEAVNSDGTVDLGISGIVVPDVPVLAGAVAELDTVVNVISYLGALLVIGSSAGTDLARDRAWGILDMKKSTASATSANATPIKDSGVGDIAFTAVAGRCYRMSYRARIGSIAGSAGATTADVQFRDNGASSPNSSSTLRGGSSYQITATGGAAQMNVVLDALHNCPADIAAGVHTVAPFYVRTAGTANAVAVEQASGQSRTFWIEDIGPATA